MHHKIKNITDHLRTIGKTASDVDDYANHFGVKQQNYTVVEVLQPHITDHLEFNGIRVILLMIVEDKTRHARQSYYIMTASGERHELDSLAMLDTVRLFRRVEA